MLGFLFAMCGATYEALFQHAERYGWLGFYISLMGAATVWKGRGSPPSEGQ